MVGEAAMRRASYFTLLLLTALAGCGSDTDDPFGGGDDDPVLDGIDPVALDPTNARGFIGYSAPNVFSVGMLVFVLADFGGDETCPKVTKSGDITTYEGGCTTMNGQSWVGKAVA